MPVAECSPPFDSLALVVRSARSIEPRNCYLQLSSRAELAHAFVENQGGRNAKQCYEGKNASSRSICQPFVRSVLTKHQDPKWSFVQDPMHGSPRRLAPIFAPHRAARRRIP